MEDLSFSDLLAVVRVTDDRLLCMQEYTSQNLISGFGDHPLVNQWKNLSQFNQRVKNVLIEKIKTLANKEGIDICDCF